MNAPAETTKEAARTYLLGNLVKAVTRRFKALPGTFLAMPKSEQEVMLGAITDEAKEAVRRAVEIVAGDNRQSLRALCESVAFKPEAVKVTLTISNSEAAHALADSAGHTVLVIIEDGSAYLGEGDATKGQEPQRDLLEPK